MSIITGPKNKDKERETQCRHVPLAALGKPFEPKEKRDIAEEINKLWWDSIREIEN